MPLANPEPPKQHIEIHIDPKLLNNYTGRYQVTPNLIFEITRDGDMRRAPDIPIGRILAGELVVERGMRAGV